MHTGMHHTVPWLCSNKWWSSHNISCQQYDFRSPQQCSMSCNTQSMQPCHGTLLHVCQYDLPPQQWGNTQHSEKIKNVMSPMAEAELGALFINSKLVTHIQHTLMANQQLNHIWCHDQQNHPQGNKRLGYVLSLVVQSWPATSIPILLAIG